MPPRALNTVARRGVACAATLFCLAALAACGSDSGATQHLLDQALHPAKRLHSGQLRMSIARLDIAGAFQALGPGLLPRFDIDASVDGRALGAISTGDQLFVRVAGASYLAPPAVLAELRQSYAQGAASGGSGSPGSLGVDPARWLTQPRRVGTASRDAVETVHIRAALDAGRFTADLRRLQAQASALGALGGLPPASPATTVTGGVADVYVGSADHLLRELSVRARGAAPLIVLLTLAQVNRPQVIQAPLHALPLSSLLSAVGAGQA